MNRSPRRSTRLFYRALVAASAVLVIAVHLPPTIFGRYANVDEAYASALAERLLEGFRLYQGAISQRGPLMYYIYALLDALYGWDNIRGLRVTALVFALAHLAMVWTAGRLLLGEGIAAVATLICAYAMTLGLHPVDGMALNGEALQVPFVLGGLLLGALAMRAPTGTRRRSWRLAAAGLLYGCAITIKQSAGLLPVPLLLWLALGAVRRSGPKERARAIVDIAIYIAAAILPASAFLAHAAVVGTLSSLWYYCVTYNLVVHRAAGSTLSEWFRPVRDHLFGHTAYFFLVAVAVASTASRWVRRVRLAARVGHARELFSRFTVEDYVALNAFAALSMAALLPQHFGHAYLLPLPLLALTATAVARRSLRPLFLDPGLRVVLAASAILILIDGGISAYAIARAGGLLSHNGLVLATAGYIERTTPAREKIFVWGFSPWLYGYSHRRPAGRYVFETYVTGFVPLYWWDLANEPARVVPGSLESLLEDLEHERPALVADSGSIEIARPMRAYPGAAAWLRAHYCFEARVGAVDLYRRREDGTPCASAYFPCPLPPMLHWGDALFAPMPPIADPGPSGLLGPSLPDQPKGFAPGEEPWPCLF